LELALKRDGSIDVRVPAVLAALQDQVSVHSLQSSSISNSTTADLLKQLLNARCQQLLQMFATSVQQDERWLLHQEESMSRSSSANGQTLSRAILAPIVQYRREKKKLLQAQMAQSAS
jgi:hypothetical protein